MTAVNPSGSCGFGFPSCYAEGGPPTTSYLYTSNDDDDTNSKDYRFEDSRMDSFSFIPPIELEDKQVIFTFHDKLALYWNKSFIFSLPELFKKVKLPQSLNQELLDKIAVIANYLAQGEEYKYVSGTARQESAELKFFVQKENHRCQVTLPAFHESEVSTYEDITDDKSPFENESFQDRASPHEERVNSYELLDSHELSVRSTAE